MRKRLLTVLLAVCLVLSIGTMGAFADESVVTSPDELIAAVNNARDGDAIILGADIVFDPTAVQDSNSESVEPMAVVRSDITLDLNNRTIRWDTNKTKSSFPYVPAFMSIDGAELTITGEGVVDAEADNNTSYCFNVINDGQLVIENGTYYGAMTVAQVQSGRLKIHGGTFDLAATIKDAAPKYSVYIINAIDANFGNDTAQIAIYGGTYIGFDPSNNPEGSNTSYVPDGISRIETGEYYEFAPAATAETGIAEVNGIYFDNLQDAFDAALSGDTVTLLDDCTLTEQHTINRGITFDLGGNTVIWEYASGATNAIGFRFADGSSELTNGAIIDARSENNSVSGWITVYVEGAASLTTGDITLTSYQPSSPNNYNYVLRADATSDETGTLTLNDGTVISELPKTDANAKTYGVVGVTVLGCYNNGNEVPNNYTGETLVINDGASIETTGFAITGNGSTHGTSIIINGGNITSTGSTAIYHPQAGVMEINGGSITGGLTGVEIRAGEVTVAAGIITGLGTPTNVEPNGNGTTSTGAGIAIAQHTTELPINLTITGGEINGYSAIYESNVEDNPSESIDLVTLSIDGGEYNAINGGIVSVYSEDCKEFITNGTFSHSVKDYVASSLNYELISDMYSYHSTIGDALDAAQPGDTIEFIGTLPEDIIDTNTVKYIDGNNVTTFEVPDGTEIELPTPDSRSGYRFAGWRDTQGNRYEAGQAITVYSDMTLTAMWNAVNVPDTTYPITIADTDNGTVSTNLTNASAGATITITAEPDEGYSVGRVVVTGPDGRLDVTRVNATTYTFKMPEGDVEVEVEFVSGEEALPFTDVTAGAWYYDAVSYVYSNGMMEGDSATTFNPDGTMTRAMFWAVLGRIDGASITGSKWAEAAREWAVTNGVSDGENASGLVTREQMVTMLWRYAGEPESSYSLSAYSDAASVSDWAEEAMSWALENGIIEGMTATTLEPQSTATRAQCATIFMRYDALEA